MSHGGASKANDIEVGKADGDAGRWGVPESVHPIQNSGANRRGLWANSYVQQVIC